MPKTLITPFFSTKRILACVVLLGVLAPGADALAQMSPTPPPPPPPGGQAAPPPSNPMCTRLEAQLAMIDRGGTGDPARDDQIRRYQDAANKQQAELERVTAQARRMGCNSSGFFSLFSGQSSQCGPVNTQIEQMRSNLDQINSSLERLRGGGGFDRESQRRSVLTALVQNSCGQQYVNALNSSGGGGGPGNFFSSLFGGNNPAAAPGAGPGEPVGPIDNGGQSGTYRTVCVRSCDGFYFPISFATVPARFPDDERTCKALCPAADATLFTYRNPGEDMHSAVSINGQPYTSLPNAFAYRQKFNPTCSCRAPGQSWADALKNIDDKSTAQQGDITVTEENAKRLSQVPTRPLPASTKKGAPAASTAPPASNPSNAAPADTTAGSQGVRTVGPTFIPAR
ncbi:MAG TPA: DUF2865 domain-containing protein [Bradyrhizobium sp.]|nr:DUF2865 domain-containing protein [Bradyrhizobium sp.]